MAKRRDHTKLSDIPKKDIFKTPEGYFDSLEERISQKISASKEGKVVKFNLSTPWKYTSLAAAAIITLLVLFLPSVIAIYSQKTSAEELIAQIASDDLLEYLKTTDLEVDDILSLPAPELWEEAMKDAVADPEWNEQDDDFLYEQYGVTPDENLQML
jgi:hypothetical protein